MSSIVCKSKSREVAGSIALIGPVVAACMLAGCGGGNGLAESAAINAQDSRNGPYTIYASSGETHRVTMNFDTLDYAIDGAASSGHFRADPSAPGTYVFQPAGKAESTARFRTKDDLLIGSYDFGQGVRPFLAARIFAASVSEAIQTYDNMSVERSAGVYDSRIHTSFIGADSTLQLCSSPILYKISECPQDAVVSYALTVADNVFTATRPGDSFKFQVAKAGRESIFLRATANADNSSTRFTIGLSDKTIFPTGTVQGGNTLGDWDTVSLTGASATSTTTWSLSGTTLAGGAFTASGTAASSASGPAGILAFTSSNGQLTGYAMQNTQLLVTVGPRGSTPTGLLQIAGR